jgi:hypothetical protein
MREIHLPFVLAVVGATLQTSPSSMADDFEGWCFPADGCTGEPMAIKNGTFATCEETCELTNPAKVEGLDATVYDVTCKADHLSEPSHMLEAASFQSLQATGVGHLHAGELHLELVEGRCRDAVLAAESPSWHRPPAPSASQ